MNQTDLVVTLESVEKFMCILCSSEMKIGGAKEGFFLAMLKAAYKKCYEFTRLCNLDEYDDFSFFLLANLRGICEDYIDLKFFGQLDPDDRDNLVKALFELATKNLVSKQTKFMKSVRPFQPVLQNIDMVDPIVGHDVIKIIAEKTKLWTYSKQKPIQNLFFRAKQIGLEEFYDFYYAVTSENVHFSPRTLLRTGWGETEQTHGNPSMVSYSTKNFNKYYKDLSKCYSLLVFVKMTNAFKCFIAIPNEVLDASQKIENSLNDILRWPEPVTYEECNIEGPSAFLRMTLKVMHEEAVN